MSKKTPITETIRDAIRKRGLTVTQIEDESGISRGAMSRFMRYERDVRGKQIDRLCEYLGLELVERKKKSTITKCDSRKKK